MFVVPVYMIFLLKLWLAIAGFQCDLQVVRGADFHDCSARWLHPSQRKPGRPENMVPRRLQRDAENYGVCERRPADHQPSLPSEQVTQLVLDIVFHVPATSV